MRVVFYKHLIIVLIAITFHVTTCRQHKSWTFSWTDQLEIECMFFCPTIFVDDSSARRHFKPTQELSQLSHLNIYGNPVYALRMERASPITCCLAPRALRALEVSQHVIRLGKSVIIESITLSLIKWQDVLYFSIIPKTSRHLDTTRSEAKVSSGFEIWLALAVRQQCCWVTVTDTVDRLLLSLTIKSPTNLRPYPHNDVVVGTRQQL